jgi:hypothetical protein
MSSVRIEDKTIEFRMDDHWNVCLHYDGNFQSSSLQHTICLGNCKHKIPVNVLKVYERISEIHDRR